ncbi:FtsK/SpoIIIE domain-containing protein [Bacillus sp. JJ722]
MRKTIELDYDGALIVRVYDSVLTDRFDYGASLFDKLNGWEIPVGTTLTKLIKHDFDKHAHVVVAGMTDYGKSVFLKNIITTLVARQTKHLKLFLVDLKGGLCFNRFRGLEQVHGVAKNADEARKILTEAQLRMEKVMQYLLLNGFEDVKEAGINERFFVVIDESADIASDTICQEIITDIARRGRAAGFRLVLATQYPTNETLKSQVRQNISAQICFKLKTEIASRAVLDEGGAEKLPLIQGRAIYRTDRKVIVQTPYISNSFIDETIKPHVTIRSRREGGFNEKAATSGEHRLVIEEA